MKKGLLILPLAVLSLAGCNPPIDYGELLGIEVLSGLQNEYVQYTTVDLNEITVKATFEEKEVTIYGSELTFSPETLDTAELGEFEITISYETKSIIWTYHVLSYEEIDNVGSPQFVVDYFANIAENNENKRAEFMDREQGFTVGDDNPFIFLPEISAYDGEGQEVDVTAYHSSSIIQEKRGSEYVTLAGAELDSVVVINEYASSYDFTEEAIGKTYKLTVRPYGEEYAIDNIYKAEFEFKVGDGYNVYKQDDLSHYDNVNTAIWDAYRSKKGLTQVNLNGLFLMNDVEIKRDFLPDGFFYMEGDSDILPGDIDYVRAIGSLRDSVDIYHRNILEGESFVFNGNYFNIDYSTLPVVVRESGRIDKEPGLVISHATVLKAGIALTDIELAAVEDSGDFSLKNLSVIGNANRTDEQPEKSGGAIFNKMQSVDSHIYNMIATQCFTIILVEYHGKSHLIEKTRGYDSFSSMLYNWGSSNLTIKDSEFIGAGGPILIADHVSPDKDGNGGYQPDIKVENTVMRSFVTGTENWFTLVSAGGASTEIQSLGATLSMFGTKTITKTQKDGEKDKTFFNLVAVLKDGAAQGPSSTKINGKFQIDEGTPLDFSGAFMTSVASVSVAYPRLESSNGNAAYINRDVPYVALPDGSPLQTPNYFTGDYMNTYVNFGVPEGKEPGFIGLVFEFFDPATIVI